MEVFFDEYDEWREGFAKAAGIDLERATEKELAFLSRLMDVADNISCGDEHRYSYIVQTLVYARKQGKSIRIVTDREYWKNGSCRDQLDGWTYHLQMYKTRPAPVYYDSQGNIFKKSPVSFTKEIKGGKIWSVNTNEKGPLYITFDKKTIYNLFGDYPGNMTPEQVALIKKGLKKENLRDMALDEINEEIRLVRESPFLFGVLREDLRAAIGIKIFVPGMPSFKSGGTIGGQK